MSVAATIIPDKLEKRKEKVAVIGAGLVGCLAALSLARLGYSVTVYEYRDDPRLKLTTDRNLRSINLAVSERGIRALNYVDISMSLRVLRNIIPMRGRMIHDLDGIQSSVRYGFNNEAINSIDRSYLNIELLNELDQQNNIKVNFGMKLIKLDFSVVNDQGKKLPRIYFEKTKILNADDRKIKTYQYDSIFGCDGAHSVTRFQLQKFIRMDYSQEFIDCCYVELYIPANTNSSKFNFKLNPNRLHIWPRDHFMLIALANFDGSFTCTFFGPWKLTEQFTKDKSTILDFFKRNFKDAINLIGEEQLVQCLINNPKNSLVCVKCFPYNYEGKIIILGDAAHAMVPFYGQGMNCGFEDVRILSELILKNNYDLNSAFDEYSTSRKEDLDAIIKLAIDNYKDMSHHVNQISFYFRKKLDWLLNKIFGDSWLPLYTMVSFRGDIPYSECIKRHNFQNKILNCMEWSAYIVGGYFLIKSTSSMK